MTLSNAKLQPRIAVELDMAEVGAHTLVATAPSLGLLLEGKYFICVRVKPKRSIVAMAFGETPKPLQKFTNA